MIRGQVNSSLEAVIEIQVTDSQSRLHAMDATVDTGYSGFLTLRPATVAALGLQWAYRAQGILANGSIGVFDVYRAVLMWDGKIRLVDIEASNVEPLVGVTLLHGHELRMQVVDGGHVTIDPIP